MVTFLPHLPSVFLIIMVTPFLPVMIMVTFPPYIPSEFLIAMVTPFLTPSIFSLSDHYSYPLLAIIIMVTFPPHLPSITTTTPTPIPIYLQSSWLAHLHASPPIIMAPTPISPQSFWLNKKAYITHNGMHGFPHTDRRRGRNLIVCTCPTQFQHALRKWYTNIPDTVPKFWLQILLLRVFLHSGVAKLGSWTSPYVTKPSWHR